MAARPRKTAEKKPEPVAEAPVALPEPEVEIVGANEGGDLATAPLEAPASPPENRPTFKGDDDADLGDVGRLSAAMLDGTGDAEVRRELYDFATGQPPKPEDVFDLEFAHGQSVICKIRLCERIFLPGRLDSDSLVVMGAGTRTDRGYADHILATLKAQLGIEQD